MSHFVFWVEYPAELSLFYRFLEQILGLKHDASGKSSIMSDFLRKLGPLLETREEN